MDKAYSNISSAWDALEEYLGENFKPTLTDFNECCEYSNKEISRFGDLFYKRSDVYLYELTHFHFSGFKDNLFNNMISYVNDNKLIKIADVGCGVGLDGQSLISKGFDVTFFDIPSQSTKYLRWRLEKHIGKQYYVYDIVDIQEYQFDLIYLVDVLEHAYNPSQLLNDVCIAANHICLNLFPHSRDLHIPVELHYPLNHWKLLPIISNTHHLMQVGISGETVFTIWKRNNIGNVK